MSAYTQLGRHLQLFTDRLDVNVVRERTAAAAAEYGLDVEEVLRGARKLLERHKQ